MKRRELFSSISRSSMRPAAPFEIKLQVEGGIEEHTDPLTLDDVLHLYRRLSYSVSMPDAQKQVGKTARQVVTQLLGPKDPPAPLRDVNFIKWRDPATGQMVDYTENPEGADLQAAFAIRSWWGNNYRRLSAWHTFESLRDPLSVERLAHFWVGHWTTEFSFDDQYSQPHTLYNQYLTFRKDRLGNFRDMALDITLDHAMLFYLGGWLNDAGRPNENYARELMELYTTGIGWYTEGDVEQAARVLTGWKVARFNDQPAPKGIYNTWFDARKHDTGAKEFMGVTIPARTADNNTEFQVRNEEVRELINIIFRARPEAVSRFIAGKVYMYFVYSSAAEIDRQFVADLAKVFRDSDFDLRELFQSLFISKHFFDPALRGSQIKTPMEYVIGLLKQLRFDDTEVAPIDSASWAGLMDQALFDPPNVAGWPGYRSWISTNTYPRRREFARKMIDTLTDARAMQLIKEMPDYEDVTKFVQSIVQYFLPLPVNETRLAYYKNTLLEGQPDYTWAEKLNQPASAARSLRALLKTIAVAPDFQLC